MRSFIYVYFFHLLSNILWSVDVFVARSFSLFILQMNEITWALNLLQHAQHIEKDVLRCHVAINVMEWWFFLHLLLLLSLSAQVCTQQQQAVKRPAKPSHIHIAVYKTNVICHGHFCAITCVCACVHQLAELEIVRSRLYLKPWYFLVTFCNW